MLEPAQSVLAAVSGGADSVCLLLVLKELGYQVSAVHVEHGIRGQESLEDCKFVQDLCAAEGIGLTVRRIDAHALAAGSGRSLEEAARDMRYRILRETARENGISVIATAHHRGDQAETVLWNLVRGSSLAGLCGIRPVRELEEGQEEERQEEERDRLKVIRPLLECGRNEIEEWLGERGIPWRTDSTNLDRSITRNSIRLDILPALEKLNSAAQHHIAQAADDLAGIECYLNEVTGREYERTVYTAPGGKICIGLDALEDLPDVIRRRVLCRALREAEGSLRDITREHVESLERLSRMENGRQISFPGDLQAVREEGVIVIPVRRRSGGACTQTEDAHRVNEQTPEKTFPEVQIDRDGIYRFTPECTVEVSFGIWEGGEVPKKKYTKVLAYDTMCPNITLRTRREGDYIVVNSAGGRKKLKSYLIDEKIPRRMRDQIPLVAQGSHVLWVTGHRISETARVTEGVHYVRITVKTASADEDR